MTNDHGIMTLKSRTGIDLAWAYNYIYLFESKQSLSQGGIEHGALCETMWHFC